MQAGVWKRVHEAILRRLREHDQIIWDRASVDAASVPAPAGGEHTGRNPTDRGKLGIDSQYVADDGIPTPRGRSAMSDPGGTVDMLELGDR
jgi:hypothetical protein